MQRIGRTLELYLAIALLCTGCGSRAAGDPDPLVSGTSEPIGVQMMRVEPHLKNQRFNTLVGFESPSDTVFVTAAGGGRVARDAQHAHTGRYALRTDAKELHPKTLALLPAGSFPGKWTLLGGYVYAPEGAQVTLAQRKLTVPPRRWTPVFMDVASARDAPAFVLRVQSPSPVWFDDLMLVDNAQDLFVADDAEASLDGPWSIRRAGLYYVINAPGRFATKLLTAEAGGPGGWTAVETVRSRARFASSGPQKSLTVYPDGRAYWDGTYRPLSAGAAEAAYAQQHAAPARVEVAEEFGRVDRDTPGDADNDGYNESRGAYMIRANGPRMEISFTPRTPTVLRPVFEIAGMPPGKAVVTIEGRLVHDHERLGDGTLLVDIPARVNRGTTISVKVD